jgi:hypothetical protein
MRKVSLETDKYTSAAIAEFLERTGAERAAVQVWRAIRNADPYDVEARQRLGNLLWRLEESRAPLGTVERSQILLAVIGESFPTEELATAYFENLETLLGKRAPQTRRPQVILGIGSGRCGSTSLCAGFAAVENSCATHENPPLIDWQPLEAQVRFHLRRFALLAQHYSLVFDAAHWWLNVLDRFLTAFPDGKVVALQRHTDDCVRSFLRIKGSGRNSVNHWAPRDNTFWGTNLWDPVYPSYAAITGLEHEPDKAKAELIRRYVCEYHDTMRQYVSDHSHQCLILETESLSEPESVQRLREFVGFQVLIPDKRLNAGTTQDGASAECFRL